MSAVRYEVLGSTATLTLDNPEKRNSINDELLDGLIAGLSAAEADRGVRSIVLTHNGGTFCAGADLSSAGKGDEELSPMERQRTLGLKAAALNRTMLTSSKPIIAAIHGHVRAGGMGFVACSDFVVAGPSATFGLSEVRIGVVAAMIGPIVLSRLGDRVAADWFLRGSAVSAQVAAAAGFVTRAVDGDIVTVEAAVEEILDDLRKASPKALAASKSLVNRGVISRIDREIDEMLELSASFFVSEEATVGMQAFLQKKAPAWVVDE